MRSVASISVTSAAKRKEIYISVPKSLNFIINTIRPQDLVNICIIADIYYQIDCSLERTEQYRAEYEFSLDVLPGYLAGGISAENYISQFILSKYPTSMKKGERKRLVREELKQAFQRECKGFPRWIQMPEWPIGSDEKPMVYIGQKAFEHHSEYYFRNSSTNEELTVIQWW